MFKLRNTPVLINLKSWTRQLGEEWSELSSGPGGFEHRLDFVIRRCSRTDLSASVLNDFIETSRCCLLVDGLDRVSAASEVQGLLDLLDDLVRQKMRRACVIVTDRLNFRVFLEERDWEFAVMDQLEPDEVKRHIGAAAYRKLSERQRDLLRSPYFLEEAVRSGPPFWTSKPEAMNSFFANTVGFDDATLKLIGKAAFDVYRDQKSSSFGTVEFGQNIGRENFDRLVRDGVLIVTDGTAEFEHDLKHDYLASKYLAENRFTDGRVRDLWIKDSFDAVTFESGSFDVLPMAARQIADAGQRDEFLIAVYDWNVYATVTCMAEAEMTGSALYSRELEVAILALVAEKLCNDPIEPTRKRIKTLLSQFPSGVARRFVKVRRLQEIIGEVRKVESNVDWFLRWKALFQRLDHPPLSQEEIALITSKDSILGWTTSNVIRRFRLADPDLERLRRIYAEHPTEDTIRWRVVHSLGASPTSENVNLLLKALDADPYLWARYGAVRSLVEMAGRTAGVSLRKALIDQLTDRVGSLPQRVLDEIGRSVFFRNPPSSWEEDVTALLEKIRTTQRDEREVQAWSRRLKEFRRFCRRQASHRSQKGKVF